MAASLESGVLVSRYSIVGPIGAGGMGEVYKAQDSSLERMVALKILPPDVVRNDERRRRFIQEARSASSLNRPPNHPCPSANCRIPSDRANACERSAPRHSVRRNSS